MTAEELKEKISAIISSNKSGNEKRDEIMNLSLEYAEQERENAFNESRIPDLDHEDYKYNSFEEYKQQNPLK